MKSPNFIVLFLLRWHVSLCRSSPATGHDSRFHFPHSPVIPFDPSLYYIFVLKTKTLRYFTVFPLLLSSPAFLFLPLVHVYMVLPYKSPPVVVIIFLRQGAFRQCPFFLALYILRPGLCVLLKQLGLDIHPLNLLFEPLDDPLFQP